MMAMLAMKKRDICTLHEKLMPPEFPSSDRDPDG
jgi:hypothetical protein